MADFVAEVAEEGGPLCLGAAFLLAAWISSHASAFAPVHSHLTPNMQADAAARLDVALRAAKKC
jgi:hypothetical protein